MYVFGFKRIGDGIFDVMSNQEVSDIVWETIAYYKDMGSSDFTKCLCDCVNNVLKYSLVKNSEDNVTVILIMFKNLLGN